jgi:hypothetical protein
MFFFFFFFFFAVAFVAESDVDVIFGGGRRFFENRTDSRMLLKEMEQDRGYVVVCYIVAVQVDFGVY